jgi:hypothetical protein
MIEKDSTTMASASSKVVARKALAARKINLETPRVGCIHPKDFRIR